MSKVLWSSVVAACVAIGLTATANAGITLSLDPLDLDLGRSGPTNASVDVFLTWDGIGTNALSSINFSVLPGTGVTLRDSTTLANPLNFLLSDATTGLVGFTNFAGDANPLVAGDNLLTTLNFDVSVVTGSIPIDLRLEAATQSAAFDDVSGQFTVRGGTLQLAVPEPSALSLLGFASLLSFVRRRKACR